MVTFVFAFILVLAFQAVATIVHYLLVDKPREPPNPDYDDDD